MIVGDIHKITSAISPDTPVIFYNSNASPLPSDNYCDGLSIRASQMWVGREGWVPCVLVELGQGL